MKTLKYLAVVLAGLVLFVACQKEFSVESGFAGSVATGSLLDTLGNCKNITVNGTYMTDSTLTADNYVTVQVNFATGGSYKIFTDTQNGFSFQDSGYIGPGVQNIKLKASGRPVQAKQTTFQVAFDTTFCSFTITVLGNTPATYSLTGSPGSCSNASVQGTYAVGTPLSAANQVTLQVNVTALGSYTINTGSVGGMTFDGRGNFTTLGPQTITLLGSGTPTTAGANSIPVITPGGTCSFTVNVAPAGSGNSTLNNSDTAWQFTGETKSFHGPFYDVFDTTINNTYGVFFLGYTPPTGDTTVQFGTFFTGTTIQTGTYSSQNFAAFYFTDYRDTANPAKIYTADYSKQTANTQLTISSYDSTTRVITGTFSGTALNASNTPVSITNGRFKAVVR